MQNAQWDWLLCTRTKSEDYFWIDDRLQPARRPDLYARVGDESSQRTGYFLCANGLVEIGVGRLDAKREDRFGRRINHTLILRALPGDTDSATILRHMFAEAIGCPSSDSAAARLARELYAYWEKNHTAAVAARSGWSELVTSAARSFTPPVAEVLPLGKQYKRTPQILERFATTAISHQGDLLLLCAATNPPSRIWPIPGLGDIPTALCAESVTRDGDELPKPQTNSANRLPVPSLDTVVKIAPKQIRKFLTPIVILAVLLTAYLMLRRSPPPSPQPAPPEVAINARPAELTQGVEQDAPPTPDETTPDLSTKGVGP